MDNNPPNTEPEQSQPDVQPFTPYLGPFALAQAPPSNASHSNGSAPHDTPGTQGAQAPAPHLEQPGMPNSSYAQAPYSGHGPDAVQATSSPTPSERRSLRPLGLLVLGFFIISLGLFLGSGASEVEKFVTIGVEFVPLAVLAALAYAGAKNPSVRVFCYMWLALVALVVLLNAFTNLILAEANLSALAGWEANPVGNSLSGVFRPGAGAALSWGTLLFFLVTLLAAAMLLRPVRVFMSRLMPVDPGSFVHKIALPILTLILFSSLVPLIVLGAPPLLVILTNGSLTGLSGGLGQNSSLSIRPVDLFYQLVWTIPAALVVAGWPVVRGFRAVMVRLSLVRPSIRQALFGVVFGVVLAAAANYVIDPGINWLWSTMGWPVTDAAAFGQLLSGVTNPIGAVLIGVTAGLGEEMAVRGLLQPRIGLLASNLLFTSLHAFQYNFDALLSVFIVGLILGIVRSRSNTTTSAIVHGVYNFTLVLGSFFLAGQ